MDTVQNRNDLKDALFETSKASTEKEKWSDSDVPSQTILVILYYIKKSPI